ASVKNSQYRFIIDPDGVWVVVFCNGAGVALFRRSWINHFCKGRRYICARDRVLGLRLPGCAFVAAYGPADGGKFGTGLTVEWEKFKLNFCAVVSSVRERPLDDKTATGLTTDMRVPVFSACDNVGVVG
ncbi:unnamed protein product, partial [Amoebophrya sp. A120]